MELRPIYQKENKTLKRIFPIAIGLLIILIMVLSVFEFGLNKDDESEIEYNGHKFTRINERWTTYISKNKISVAYQPKDLEDTRADVSYNDLLLSNKIYLSFDQEQPALFVPIREFIQNKNILGFQDQLILACPYDNEACSSQNLPLKSCNDTDDLTGVILFEYSNSTSMDFGNNCLRLSGTQESLTKTIDRLVLKRLGIM